jgi:DNA-directed RNA polymerase specialized sigma24 family protein
VPYDGPERHQVTAKRAQFATTCWSVVIAAGAESSARDAAVTRLYESYWYPLYAHLRGRGCSTADAEDLVQGFFLRLMEKGALQDADPARGRFRSFMVASLQHFAFNERDRAVAEKRGGGTTTLSLDVSAAEGRFLLEPASVDTPETLFNRRWALMLLGHVIGRLRREMGERGREGYFEALKPYLTGDPTQSSYAVTAVALDMSEGAVKVAVHRLRRRFRELVRDEVAQTVGSPTEIDDELRYLRGAVRRL